jgi:hypothetical protein
MASQIGFWSETEVPQTLADPDDTGVELGLKFRSSVDGVISGIQFYKATQNTGTHDVHLWTAAGTLLATATLAASSQTGWQTVNFSTPVAIKANTTYVASYYAPNGRYSINEDYFDQPLTSDVLSTTSNAGVYAYGGSGQFPTSSWNSSNYWVDVVFEANGTASGNTQPVAVNDRLTTAEDTVLRVSKSVLLGNDSDADGDALTITSVGNAVHGRVSYDATTGTVKFRPESNYDGPASFEYRVSDGNGGKTYGFVDVSVTPDTTTPINNAPVAKADGGFITQADRPITIQASALLANDTDADGDPLTVTQVASPSHGTVNLNTSTGAIVFTPQAGYTGPAAFTYTISDGNGAQASSTVSISVEGTAGGGRSLWVGQGEAYQTLSAAIAASRDGDTIYVRAGTYTNDFATINTKISIIGVGGLAKLEATQQIGNGKGILITNTDVRIENLEFTGARVADQNGAGIRHQGGDLVVVNSYFHHNENGILAAPLPSSTIEISRSEFAFNGRGDGYTHGVYVNALAQLHVTDSYFHDTRIGHHVKSRASETIIENSRLDDGNGTASYNIDLPNGGRGIIRDNVIIQSSGSDNPAIIHFGGEGSPYAGSSLLVENNVIENFRSSAVGVANQTNITVTIRNNELYNLPNVASGPNTQSGNTPLSNPTVPDTSHPWEASGTAAVQQAAADSGDLLAAAPAATVDGFWDTTVSPQVLSDPDDQSVELGLKFRSTVDGVISGIQLYKSAQNTGSHDVHLWTAAGTLLATATLAASSQTGWQTVNFSSPVAIKANTTYVASYHAPNGGYSVNENYFGQAFTNGVLSTTSNAGVYAYGSNGRFPTNTWNASNYWVDVVFAQSGGTANTAPVALADSVSTDEDTVLRIAPATLLANDSDANGDRLTITGVGNPTRGTVTLDAATGDIVFTPAANLKGLAGFTYTVADGRGGTATGTVTVTINGVNDAPVATDDAGFTTTPGTPLTLQSSVLLANDTDVEGHTLKITTVGNAANGTVSLNTTTGAVTFTPTAGYTGAASFTYTVSDIRGATDTARVNLNVTSGTGNAPPVANDDTGFSTTTGTALSIQTSSLLGNDSDANGDALSITSVGNAANGTVTLNTGSGGPSTLAAPTGGIVFTPNAGYSGPASFSYTVSDGKGGTDTATVTVNVTAGTVNAAPVAVDDGGFTTRAGSPLSIQSSSLLANDTDANGDALSITSVGGASHGTVSLNASTGAIVFTPTAGYTGAAGFTYTVSDGKGGTDTATVDVSVTNPTSSPGAITTIQLNGTSGALTPGEMVSFGQAFAPGDLPGGTVLTAMVNGQAIPIQMDVKATNDDGSVRHAILTVKVPAGTSASEVDIVLARGSGAPPAPPSAAAAARDILADGYDLKVEVTTSDGVKHVVDAAAALQTAINQGDLDVWMNGSMASEFRVTAAITNDLLAQFDIRAYANGEVRTDVTIANDWIRSSGGSLTQPGTVNYSVAIKEGGQTVFSKAGVNHHKNANWHTEVWSGGSEPDIQVTRDIDYLVRSGAIPAVDTGVTVNSSKIQSDYNAIQNSNTGPMGSGTVTKYMPGTGGRDDIGVLPAWTMRYLLSQDPRAEKVMMGNADASGSIPFHLRDGSTGDDISIDDHPGISTIWVNGQGADRFKSAYNSSAGGWTVDSAHQPQLAYVPYLLTGQRYYLDELQAAGNYNMLERDPSYRQGATGLLEQENQVRAQAWSLRSLGYAAWVTPDDDAQKNYFENKLANNFNAYVRKYVTNGTYNSAGEVEGYIFKLNDRDAGAISPWEDDFFTATVSHLANMGIAGAESLLDWKMNYTAGRFISEELGFNPFLGTNYRLWVASGGGTPFDTWEQVTSKSGGWGQQQLYENVVSGYADVARGMLADLITATGDPRAIEAFGFIVGETDQKFKTDSTYNHSNNPTWARGVVLPDGSVLSENDMRVGGTGNETLNGTTSADLLHGKGGNDAINGNGGIDLVFGGDGNDAVNGGDGNDYVFGNKGADTINGGRGADFLKGNQDADVFVFARTGDGRDVIADFETGTDRISIQGLSSADAQTLINQATNDGQGNAVIHLSATDHITLEDVSVSQLTMGIWLLQ